MILDARIFLRSFEAPLRPFRPFTTLTMLYDPRILPCDAYFATVEAYTLADEVETMVHPTTQHYDSSCAFCLGNLWVVFEVFALKMLISWNCSLPYDPRRYQRFFETVDDIVFSLYFCEWSLHSDASIVAHRSWVQIILIFLFSCTTTLNFPNDEWTNTSRTQEPTHDLPKSLIGFAWLSICPPIWISPTEPIHHYLPAIATKKNHILWSMRLFHHRSTKPKRISRLVSTSVPSKL